MSLPPGVTDDKVQHVVPFVLDLLQQHDAQHARASEPVPPLIIGLSAPQGAGKSVLVSLLYKTLTSPPHNHNTVVFSIDDFYLTHDDQVKLAEEHPDNPLLQHRGQPGTHDVPLMVSAFNALRKGQRVKIPQYNKAAFLGQGDRMSESDWQNINTDPQHPLRIVLFEGWCVGFRPLPEDALRGLHAAAASAARRASDHYQGRLGRNTLESVMTINDYLQQYNKVTDMLDGFVHIDAAEPSFVYKWRTEQEEELRRIKGSGMTEEQVQRFVDGYFPAYELYVEGLRQGVFNHKRHDQQEKRQLRLVVGEDRKVTDVLRL